MRKIRKQLQDSQSSMLLNISNFILCFPQLSRTDDLILESFIHGNIPLSTEDGNEVYVLGHPYGHHKLDAEGIRNGRILCMMDSVSSGLRTSYPISMILES
jgi:hypothetical protein